MAKHVGLDVASQSFSEDIGWDNSKKITAKNIAGTQQDMLTIDSADLIQLGPTDSSVQVSIGAAANFGTSGAVTLNESGADADFRVEGTGDVNLLFSDAGNNRVGIKEGNPATELDVNGTITCNGLTLAGTSTLDGAATFNESGADADFRVESDGQANMLFVDAGNDRVGIANASPATALDVTGTITASALEASGASFTSGLSADGAAVFNESGNDADFRVEGSSNINALFVDAGNDRVGILNGSPATALDITGTVTSTGMAVTGTSTFDGAATFNEAGADLDFRVESDGQANMLFVDAGNNRVGIANASPSTELDITGTVTSTGLAVTGSSGLNGAVTVNESGADVDFRVEGDTDINAFIVDASSNNVGFGVAAPSEKVEVNGGIKVTGAAPGPPSANTLYKDSIVKGWINFNGTGTIAIRDSFNVSSITDNGTGDYDINWDLNFANTDFCTPLSTNNHSGGTEAPQKGVGITRVVSFATGGALTDDAMICVSAMGDQ